MSYSKYLINKIECPIGIETIKGKEDGNSKTEIKSEKEQN